MSNSPDMIIQVITFFLSLSAFNGMAAGSSCKTKYSLGISYYKYCYGSCCYYDSYIDPCCSESYYVNIYSASISIGAIVGIVIGVLVIIAIIVTVIVCCVCVARGRQASAGQVISTGQPGVAYTVQNNSSNQGMIQPQYGVGYENTGFASGTANQPPPYPPMPAGQTYPQQNK